MTTIIRRSLQLDGCEHQAAREEEHGETSIETIDERRSSRASKAEDRGHTVWARARLRIPDTRLWRASANKQASKVRRGIRIRFV